MLLPSRLRGTLAAAADGGIARTSGSAPARSGGRHAYANLRLRKAKGRMGEERNVSGVLKWLPLTGQMPTYAPHPETRVRASSLTRASRWSRSQSRARGAAGRAWRWRRAASRR